VQIIGGKPLSGCVAVNGAKNDVLPKMAASLVFRGNVTLRNVPSIADVTKMIALLRGLGADVQASADGTLTINADDVRSSTPRPDMVAALRHSFYLAGPLLIRMKYATLSTPGGCAIGARPVDFHINALRQMGATVQEDPTKISFAVRGAGGMGGRRVVLQGAHISLDRKFRSVGTTNHVMMTAAVADGTTRISNASAEPETIALGRMLQAGGAQITGLGTRLVVIQGQGKLLNTVENDIIGDRMEAGTFMLAAVATGGDIRVEGWNPADGYPLLEALSRAGAGQVCDSDGIRVRGPEALRPIDVSTGPFAGFPTDMAPLWAAMMTQAIGVTTITENIFEARTGHAEKLEEMGARVRVDDGRVVVCGGGPQLRGVEGFVAGDIREGAALVIAALCAEGRTTIDDTIMRRGYSNLAGKLRSLGADVE